MTGKEADAIIQTVLGMITGLIMIGATIVLILAAIAVFTGITTHNLLSILALAGVFGVIAAGLQWLLQKMSIGIEDKQTFPELNDRRTVPDGKQNTHFDPWTDEWYGNGPWWKKW